ncbi:Crp/Fnr family transcriptional regulator [Bacillus tianshenii]|nr:Crp/Fnr family transcriptional regulator [Bacillus tianshenii]
MSENARKRDIDLISPELRNLLKSISTPKKISKGSFLFQEGMESEEIYLIQDGLVQISKLTVDGKELTLRICKRDDIVGELTLFSDNAKYMLSALAVEDSEILTIKKEKLEQELVKNSELTFEFMKWVSTHLRKIQSKIRDLVLSGKKGALYSTLIRLSNSYGVQKEEGILIDLSLTNQDLAKFCASTRESVNRSLSELRKLGILSTEPSGKLFIRDIEHLKAEIGCEYCSVDICNID